MVEVLTMALPLGHNATFGASVAYEQLVRDQHHNRTTRPAHAAPKRGLDAPLRSLEEAIRETMLARAELHTFIRSL